MTDRMAEATEREAEGTGAPSARLFETLSPRRLFLRAAVPGALSMLASSLYSTVDVILVGNYLGETAFAAVNLAMPFVIVLFAMADLIGVGSSVPIAIALGRHDEETASNAFTCACVMIVASSAALGALVFAAAPALMALCGASGELARLAVEYLRVYALCLPGTAIFYAVDNYMRICGRTRESLGLNVLMAALGAGLELLVLGVLGWGVGAAAAAYSASLLTCSVVAFVPFARGRMVLRFVRPRPSARLVRQIAACGTPTFLNNVAGRVTSVLMNYFLLASGGETAVSAYGILMSIDGVVQALLYGMVDSLQPAVGYNWGARLFGRVREIERWCFGAAAAGSVALGCAAMAAPEPLIHLFVGGADEALVSMAVPAIRIFCLAYLVRWVSFASQSYLMAIERSRAAATMSVCTVLVFPVLLIVCLRGLGLTGFWLNMPVTALLSGLLALWMLRGLRDDMA